MNSKDFFQKVDRNSKLYEEFRNKANEKLQEDKFKEANKEWEQFFVSSHGAIFERLQLEEPRKELFIDSLYFDYIVDGIIKHCQDKFGFNLRNIEPKTNTKAISFSFGSLHSEILDPEKAKELSRESFDKELLLNYDVDFLRKLYENVISREMRLELGEYYTPQGVAELAVSSINGEQIKNESFLDPGCGSGIFLYVCIKEKMEKYENSEKAIKDILRTVYGIDLNPVAVKSSKLTYILSLLPLIEETNVEEIEIPVFLTDALKLTREDDIYFSGEKIDIQVDNLVGNPPWITWDRLSEDIKEKWKEKYVSKLNLMPHKGTELRLGHSNDDISVPFIWVTVHNYLKENGSTSFVLKRNIMKNTAGKLLRTTKVGDRSFSIANIEDFNDLKVFGDQVGANSAVYTFEFDQDTNYPVKGRSWEKVSSFDTEQKMLEGEFQDIEFVPVDETEKFSPLIRKDAERSALGECEHDIRHGIKDDAKEVFKIDREELENLDLETELIYPYIKSRHIIKYGLLGHELHLVPIKNANEDNENEISSKYPNSYDYLQENKETLENRSSSWLDKGTFYNVFGIGDYTWSEYKVAWCRLGWKPHFSVISSVTDEDVGEKKVIPGDHYMFIPTDNKNEAYFLTALLNSSVYQRTLEDIASEGKSSLSKKVVSRLNLPKWEETEETLEISELSKEAHQISKKFRGMSRRKYKKQQKERLEEIQSELDEKVEKLLTQSDLFAEVDQRVLSTF